MRQRRGFTAAAAATGAVTAIYFVWLILKIGGEHGTNVFTDLMGIPTAVIPGLACVHAGRRASGQLRRAWVAIGVGLVAWGLGEVVWSYYELIRHREVPFPGLSDLGYLALIPLGVVGMLSFPTAPRSAAARVRAILDGLIIASSVLFIGSAVVLGPAYAAGAGGSVLEQSISLSYPLGDLAIIAIVLYVFMRAGRDERTSFALIGAGLVCVALSDFGFTFLTLHDLYRSGSLIDPFWSVGFMLIGLAALRRPEFDRSSSDERRIGRASMVGPYVPFLAAIAVAACVEVIQGELSPLLFWNAVVCVLVVVVRQLVSLVDNSSLNRELETRVQERTSELSRTLTELEESTRLQDEFVANTSHELLTPLTVILASIETLGLEDGQIPPFVSSSLEVTGRAAQRMKRLVEDVLLTSGITNRIDCDHQPFDVDQQLRDAISASDVSDKGVELRVRIPLQAVGDTERFRVIVQHLLTNADKFAPRGSTITIDAFDEGGSVHVTVADEGPGIPPDLRENVFRRFFQVDGSSTRRHGGTGLGLFLARQLAVSMRGTLEIDDTIKGARLHLTLPAAGMRGASATRPGELVASEGVA